MRKKPTVVVVDQGHAARYMDPAEARRLVAENEAQRQLRRRGRTVYRLRRHLAPWWAAGIVMALGATTWAVRWLIGPSTAITLAVIIGLLVGFIGWLAGRRTGQWRRRVYLASAVAAVWLSYTAQIGPSWRPPLVLAAVTVALGARWWQTVRIPHPKAPAAPEPVKQVGPVEQLWAENIADAGGVLPRSYLTDKDTRQPNTARYVVNLRPGKQTLTMYIGSLEKIAGGLMVPVKSLVLEPHPNENPNQGLLTVVRRSPIEKTVPYAGARITGSHRHLIEIGPYGDSGFAPWRMWQPGEKPMTGSALSGFIVGGVGIGKSRLMELLATGYMASGYSVVWFADPQGGASSPALQEHADWYVDSDGVPTMLAALERIAQWRERENATEGWTRFDPSPARPLIVVFLDECHVSFTKYGRRWADLARKCQKVGIALVGLTQYAALESLGGQEPLRAALLANAIIMRTESKQQGQLIPGIEVDPMSLPAIPGFGYVLKRGNHGRTAPFRAEYLAEPEQWMARYDTPPLDTLSANAAGEPYQMRAAAAAEMQEMNRRQVEAMRGGVQEVLDFSDPEPDGATVPVFPPPPNLPIVPEAEGEARGSGRDRILEALAHGTASPRQLQQSTGLGETRVRQLLKDLTNAGRVEQVSRGTYRLTSLPPEGT